MIKDACCGAFIETVKGENGLNGHLKVKSTFIVRLTNPLLNRF